MNLDQQLGLDILAAYGVDPNLVSKLTVEWGPHQEVPTVTVQYAPRIMSDPYDDPPDLAETVEGPR